jgi:hypothetical protein
MDNPTYLLSSKKQLPAFRKAKKRYMKQMLSRKRAYFISTICFIQKTHQKTGK